MMAHSLKNYRESIVNGNPLGRIGTPADICGVAFYLSSKAGSWVTGVVIPVEGGILAKGKL
jgi:NAD(P)-dependent dehydrogenase (short-subunit alcohol dehydrogenase family)